jgi:lipopolysaccharide transport system ATP-binding protein
MPAIRVQHLGKCYRIEHAASGRNVRYRTLRESLIEAAARPIRRLRNPSFSGATEDFWALKDVDFQVEPGEVVGVIGANGAGKSTLLKILTKITDPTCGEADLWGRVGSLLEVGTGFHPELTGRENIFLNGAILGMTRAEIRRQFDAMVDFSGVEKFLDTPVKRYSSGMKVRLAFSVAAHLQPEILLIDEVLAVGDAEFQRKCLGKMDDVAKSGRTVLFVSHDMGAISQLCSRCLLFHEGQIASDGPTNEVISDYQSTATTDGYIDLEEWRVDRLGPGPSRITFLELLDNADQRRTRFGYGEDIVFRFGVRSSPGARLIANVIVYNGMGQMICNLNSADDELQLAAPTEHFELRAMLPEHFLNDGRYCVSLSINSSLRTREDQVNSCLSFDVDSSAGGFHRAKGAVRATAQWTIAAEDSLV